MEFLMSLSGPVLYLMIFVAKTVEVSIATIRLVYNSKGERFKGAILGFFEVMIWILVVSSVLNNITEDPIKIIAYAGGFSLGNLLGVYIESLIAIGISSIQVVVNAEIGETLARTLREHSFGVTIIDGEGKDRSKKNLIFVQLKRKKMHSAIKIIRQTDPQAYISVNEVKSTIGGFIKK